ncbi:unnamed protein product [Calicophoron daubneyi]|uniref:Amino acid transporter transmembrane domain-containing protein n=1 Tax=Calicophoron daubneyi TaxID=300641 RepID=A0AAV2TDZ1_CALDB
MLAYCADYAKANSFQETLKRCCGHVVHTVCAITLAMFTFGVCVTYLVVIGDMWDKVFEFAISDPEVRQSWFLDRRFIITLTSLALILPISFPKRIAFLRYPSPDSWSDIFYVLPAICFGYQCHINSVPVYAELRGRPNLRLYGLVAGLGIGVTFIIYFGVGTFGYLSFGSHCSADILVNYPPTLHVIVGLAMLAVNIYSSYPIYEFCGRSAISTVLIQYCGWSAEKWSSIERRFRYISTVVWYTVSLLLALFVPNIGPLIGLMGSLAAFFVFSYPGLALLSVMLQVKPEKVNVRHKALMAVSIFYILLGVFFFGLTFSQAVVQIIRTV